jgi:hypothetical protein
MSRLGTAYLRAIQAVGRRLSYGMNVFERSWDVLVVLDGCRADLLASVADDYEFLDDPGSIRSVGSASSEWLENTFVGHPETEATVMVTANTWTDRYLDADAFAAVDEVWKYAWDDDHGTIPAAAVTDRAISHAREDDPDRLVVHYMQPHHPFVPDPLDDDDGLVRAGSHSNTANPWVALRQDEVSVERVRMPTAPILNTCWRRSPRCWRTSMVGLPSRPITVTFLVSGGCMATRCRRPSPR